MMLARFANAINAIVEWTPVPEIPGINPEEEISEIARDQVGLHKATILQIDNEVRKNLGVSLNFSLMSDQPDGLNDIKRWALDRDIASGGGGGLPLWPEDQLIPSEVIHTILRANRILDGRIPEHDLSRLRYLLVGSTDQSDHTPPTHLRHPRQFPREEVCLELNRDPRKQVWPDKYGEWHPFWLFYSIAASGGSRQYRFLAAAQIAARAALRISPFLMRSIWNTSRERKNLTRSIIKYFECWSVIIDKKSSDEERKSASHYMKIILAPYDLAAWCAEYRWAQIDTCRYREGDLEPMRAREVILPDGTLKSLSVGELSERARGASLEYSEILSLGLRAINSAARAISMLVEGEDSDPLQSELIACATDAVELSALFLRSRTQYRWNSIIERSYWKGVRADMHAGGGWSFPLWCPCERLQFVWREAHEGEILRGDTDIHPEKLFGHMREDFYSEELSDRNRW